MTYTDTEDIIGQLENSGLLVTYNEYERYYNIYESGPFFNFHMRLDADDNRSVQEIIRYINMSYDTFVKETKRLANLFSNINSEGDVIVNYD